MIRTERPIPKRTDRGVTEAGPTISRLPSRLEPGRDGSPSIHYGIGAWFATPNGMSLV